MAIQDLTARLMNAYLGFAIAALAITGYPKLAALALLAWAGYCWKDAIVARCRRPPAEGRVSDEVIATATTPPPTLQPGAKTELKDE